MELIHNRTIAAKVILGMMLVAAIGSGVEVFAITKVASTNHRVGVAYDGAAELQKIAELQDALSRLRTASLRCATSGDSAGECQLLDNEKALLVAEDAYKQ